MKVRVTFDGGCYDNPHGRAASGAVVTDLDGRTLCHVGRAIEVGSNNYAEWGGLILGLEAAAHLGATDVEVFGDSQLVVRQFNGEYRIKAEPLRRLADHAQRLREKFSSVTVKWHPREENRAADAICTKVLEQTYTPDPRVAHLCRLATSAESSKAAHTARAETDRSGAGTSAAVGVRPASEITIAFVCNVTMMPKAVAAARARGKTDAQIRADLGARVERRLLLAGQLDDFVIKPARIQG